MLKINDDTVFVNYIKQILSSFPLPNAKVLTHDSYKEYLVEGRLYLADNEILQYSQGKFKKILDNYIYGKKYVNYTRNFINSSLVYDSDTHEYLGEYLRFLRDYKQIDFMSMYNCYSKRFMQNTNIKTDYNFEINTEDSLYKYIVVPVKLNKNYTIALDANLIEITCAFYNKSYYTASKWDEDSKKYVSSEILGRKTYLKKTSCKFSDPFLYTKLQLEDSDIEEYKKFIYSHEKDLKLIIKLPKDNSSSIVILEGEYLNTNDTYYVNSDINKIKRAHSRINFENKELNDYSNLKFKSQLQLLEYNTKEDNVLSDRLLEYLSGLPITNIEDISENISRLQTCLVKLWKESKKVKVQFLKGTEIKEEEIEKHPYGMPYIKQKGIWEDSYKALLYSMATNYGLIESRKDILGYLDKDLETKIGK